jgi:hypothetical protein
VKHLTSMRLGEHNYGMAHAIELAMAFMGWAQDQKPLTPSKVMLRWSVSRATAYRWLASYRAVRERTIRPLHVDDGA